MLKKSILFLFLFSTSLFIQAQDEVRDLNSFSAVSVSEGIKVKLHQGDPRAEIDMIKGDIDDLIVEVKGGTAILKFKKKNKIANWNNNNNRKVEIDLYADQSIEEIDLSSGANLKSNYTLTGNSLDVDVSSGANVDLEVEYKNVDVDVSSGAYVHIEGDTGDLDVDISSGASFRGENLKSKDAFVDASSGASAKVWATERLSADATSGASISYKGNPSKTNIGSDKWSGGRVSKM